VVAKLGDEILGEGSLVKPSLSNPALLGPKTTTSRTNVNPRTEEAGRNDWKSLFDGKTLKGWQGDLRFWRVEDGAITGETTSDQMVTENTFLISNKETRGDFELIADFKLIGGNSGIQYRSFEVPDHKWAVGGYQADIDAENTETGSIYGERFREMLASRGKKTVIGTDHQARIVESVGDPEEIASHIKREDWNTYHITARGSHLEQRINGVLTAVCDDEDTEMRRSSGIISLQLHAGYVMKVQFRNIEIKELSQIAPNESATASKSLARWDTPAFQQWMKGVAALPAEGQLNAVVKKLQELNPGFDGKVTGWFQGQGTPVIEVGVVREVGFSTDNVTDISPIRALTGLRRLGCSGQKLTDLTPLSGLLLECLYCHYNPITDISPLKNLPLKELYVWTLTPTVEDISALKGMKLEVLFLGLGKIKEISVLSGMPLRQLAIDGTQVSDLSPLKGMPLQDLNCRCTPVSDLSPLTGMPLTRLDCCPSQVSDLSPLAGMKLINFRFVPKNITKGMDAIRQMKSLEVIGSGWSEQEQFSPEVFWKKYDAGEFGNARRPAVDSQDGFVPLFNGRDLTGWNVYPEGTGNWKVEDGLLIGSGPASYLFSKRGDYQNFRFRVEVQINDHGNSGQFFRTQFGPGFPKGYEAQINSTHGDPVKTGSLHGFEETAVREMLVPPGEWFTQEVLAIGNHLVIKVNGKTTVDYNVTDPNKFYSQGHFALQQHDPGTVVKFRKIEVLALPAK